MGKWELLPTVLKANGECQVKLEEESDGSIWEGLQQGKGGVKIWLLVQTERSLCQKLLIRCKILGGLDFIVFPLWTWRRLKKLPISF